MKRLLFWGCIFALAAIATGYVMRGGTGREISFGETVKVVRGPLIATVTESGEIKSANSTEIKCMVEKESALLWIVEEGSLVKKGDKLIELDSTSLGEDYTSRKMELDNAVADYQKAVQQYDIQESQNESTVSEASRKVRFALLDLKKYLGDNLAKRLEREQPETLAASLSRDPSLGGSALQKKRELTGKIELAREEHSRASSKVQWSRKLKKKGHLTGSELEADEFALKHKKIDLQQSGTALELFLKYEFPKDAEKYYTDWQETRRELQRVKARSQSELAGAKADLGAKATILELEKGRFAKIEDQLKKTVISAPRDGMVVYYRGDSPWQQDREIKVGTEVRYQQVLIQLPDLANMNVKSKLHESVVEQVEQGAIAFIVIDAWPESRLTGKVEKIAVMPDRSLWFLDPGVKSYSTYITLDETPPGLKPGMSAMVEIVIDKRVNVLLAPVSSVYIEKGARIVYVKTSRGPAVRKIRAGLSNDRNIEIISGLEEGEEIYLYKPDNAPEVELEPEPEKEKKS